VKICNVCGGAKPLTDYYANSYGRDGTRPECKECTSARRRAWYESNREREIERVRQWSVQNPARVRANMQRFTESGKRKVSNRKSHLKRKYGMTLDDFDALLASQGGGCAICGKPDPDNVDHDHVTGRVRGILCWNCNIGVGQFEDSEDRLAAATSYIAHDDELAGLARDRVVALRG
jgi:hypothetical protein